MDINEFTIRLQELTPKPKQVLELLLKGKTDDRIAQEIGASPGTVRKHIQNLCDRFEIDSEVAGLKKNRREDLIALFARYKPELVSDRFSELILTTKIAAPATSSNDISDRHPDWGDAPEVLDLYGREQELETLEKWIVQDKSRIVALLGMGGIGKTSLAVKLAQQIHKQFQFLVIWRTLRNAPPLNNILTDFIKALSGNQKPHLPEDINQQISLLIEYLQNHRCLLVIDNWEGILSSNEFVGHYEPNYKDYGKLLRRLGEESHQSCLLLISRENPREIPYLEAKSLPIRTLQLEGLGESARQILQDQELSGQDQWRILINLYRGNPLALKIIAKTIEELFNGNVAEFLDQSLTLVVRDIAFLIEDQVNRLSQREKEILYWLAIEENPISLKQLRDCFLLPVSPLELLDALESLNWRSLLEKQQAKYTLQPAVKQYVTNEITKVVCREISHPDEKLNLLRTHALKKLPELSEVKENTNNSLIAEVKNKLYTAGNFRDQTSIIANLKKIQSMLAGKPQPEIGYADTNVENLLKEFA
ncbi:NB-ARC domain-containing protein [Floridanema aerugineum]|uniref:NB-ARC domain-containing protein n=1 Tax=Floridaenema aerugineum BLCC-F46 TaxID=3153654 RepID=A0ABV4X775_9CYAN